MIRKITDKDLEEIKRLLNYFPAEIQENLFLESQQALNNNVNGFVYTKDNNLLGYIVLRKWGGVYWLDTLVVSKEFQGKGIGKQLVEFTKQRCIQEKIPQLNTCTFEEKNISFYKKLGFVAMGELNGPFMPLNKRRFYFKWENPNFN